MGSSFVQLKLELLHADRRVQPRTCALVAEARVLTLAHACPRCCHCNSRVEQLQFELSVPQFYDLLKALETAQRAV